MHSPMFTRAFHGVEPHRGAVCLLSKSHGAVRCGFYFLRIVRCGAVRCGAVRIIFVKNRTVRSGAVRIVFPRIVRCSAVRCGFVGGKIVRCGAVRLNRTEPHRTVKSFECLNTIFGSH